MIATRDPTHRAAATKGSHANNNNKHNNGITKHNTKGSVNTVPQIIPLRGITRGGIPHTSSLM